MQPRNTAPLSLRLRVPVSLCLFLSVSVFVRLCPFLSVSVCLCPSLSVSVCLPAWLAGCLSSVCVSLCLSVSVCLRLCLSVCLWLPAWLAGRLAVNIEFAVARKEVTNDARRFGAEEREDAQGLPGLRVQDLEFRI